jgi:hypothetical protein
MNEQIKELAEQAGINCVVPTIGTLEYSGKGEVEHLKKFAELIVRECARVCNENVGLFTPGCGNAVLEHFGVEE